MVNQVDLSKHAIRDLRKVPLYIAIKLKSWVEVVEMQGLQSARKVPGYHDEPLKGSRVGQRSIRLSRSYRAFYSVERVGQIEKVLVQEVNKHEY